MNLVGKSLLTSKRINFSEVTMAFDRLFETILLTNEHNWSLESPMTRNDSVRFVPRATVGQQCKKRRTSWAGYDFVPKLGQYNMRCGLYIGRAYVDGPPF